MLAVFSFSNLYPKTSPAVNRIACVCRDWGGGKILLTNVSSDRRTANESLTKRPPRLSTLPNSLLYSQTSKSLFQQLQCPQFVPAERLLRPRCNPSSLPGAESRPGEDRHMTPHSHILMPLLADCGLPRKAPRRGF